jgi:hypothetical protein
MGGGWNWLRVMSNGGLCYPRFYIVMTFAVHFMNLNQQFSPKKDIKVAYISLKNIKILFENKPIIKIYFSVTKYMPTFMRCQQNTE